MFGECNRNIQLIEMSSTGSNTMLQHIGSDPRRQFNEAATLKKKKKKRKECWWNI